MIVLKRHKINVLLSALLLSSTTQAQPQAPAQPQFPQAPKAPTAIDAIPRATAPKPVNPLSAPELEAQLELNISQADEQDEDGRRQRDTGTAQIALTLGVKQQLGPRADLNARLGLSSVRFSEEELNNDDDEFSYELERLHFDFEPNETLLLRVGRQGIDDPMETIVDQDLDGIRIRYRKDQLEFELSHTRKDWFEASSTERDDNVRNILGSFTYHGTKGSHWMPYVLHRSAEQFESNPTSEKTWFGLQGIIEPINSPVRYWVHASGLMGTEQGETEDIDLGGFLVDVGINWKLDIPLKPTLTLAATHASGGTRNKRFTQSGLQGNDFALNGYNSFRYRGEVLDPELTNIQILTFGIGARIAKDWEADFALHSYNQVEVEDRLRGSDIEFDPLGVDAELGFGADFVISFSPLKQLDLKGSTGAFSPGDAFAEDSNLAWVTQLEIDWHF